ncbi:myb-like DNA-binding shaqkyf class family protein, putative [Ichthyophthirius multifiliis]|uniref:Myb-like DNA-binding shaqkyf class family protein, putative n=1 Tax=Ichthyophthirius multifiliis TaxID=5932 RepID=G0QWZ6_ICHMU|nr:myb-like DNA-binding shaqkyf class family protein, putative [Ichthyophthirius multifiliis]EGR30260.1 myb-like DNA-binding shaqkyf class family protein, putative [Ichthyophthirius multifiliis]|eukprot:XP_004031856.1 myb-like DNA-binding shaqkyf class family protein, putative [Ichthyophthirius multifiliis]
MQASTNNNNYNLINDEILIAYKQFENNLNCSSSNQSKKNSCKNSYQIEDNNNDSNQNFENNLKQTGRWTQDEHKKFIEGINMYGKNWKVIEQHIGTRTGSQIRSHAQKFFIKIEKEFYNNDQKIQSQDNIIQILNNKQKAENKNKQINIIQNKIQNKNKYKQKIKQCQKIDILTQNQFQQNNIESKLENKDNQNYSSHNIEKKKIEDEQKIHVDQIIDKYVNQIYNNTTLENSFFISRYLPIIQEATLYNFALQQANNQLEIQNSTNYIPEIYVPKQCNSRKRLGSFQLHDKNNEEQNLKYQNFRKVSADETDLKKKQK